jgi:hypothetical protein
VVLKFNGDPISAKKSFEEKVNIPPIGDFKINQWQMEHHPEQKLTLFFSDYIDDQQDLRGLIKLKGYKNTRFVVEGNKVILFLTNYKPGRYELTINNGIRNSYQQKLENTIKRNITLPDPKPKVRMLGEGNIMPGNGTSVCPFEAIGLKKVDISIYKIKQSNVLQFLQVNQIDGSSELKRVAEPVASKTITLNEGKNLNLQDWNRYALNLSEIVRLDPGGIYRVRLTFKKSYTFNNCQENAEYETYSSAYYDYYENDEYNNLEDYTPCDRYYYYYATVSKNFLISDLGLISKWSNNNTLTSFVTDIKTAQPITNAKVIPYNYAQSKLSNGSYTNQKGYSQIQLDEKPSVIMVEYGNQKGYLKIADGKSNSTSRFEVGGTSSKSGIKGYFYGERGVWRPGDSIYLSFMLHDVENTLPSSTSGLFKFTNPKGQVKETRNIKINTNGITTIRLHTQSKAVTGYWNASLSFGNENFQKSIQIETIRPNRLKLFFEPESDRIISSKDSLLAIQANWLHGANANGLKATVEAVAKSFNVPFPKYKSYQFSDEIKKLNHSNYFIYDGKLDNNGHAEFSTKQHFSNAPGPVRLTLKGKVFEQGGAFSADQKTFSLYPHQRYVGVDLPLNRYGILPVSKKLKFPTVLLNPDGTKVSGGKKLQVNIYKIEWSWWWQRGREDLASYIKSNSFNQVLDTQIIVNNGEGAFYFKVPKYEWGRYYINVEDPEGNHSFGKVTQIDYYGHVHDNQSANENLSMLAISSNKTSYSVNESIDISFDSPSKGKALISVENNNQILEKYWVSCDKGKTRISLLADEMMTPNVYIHVSLVQSLANKQNDLPLRLYGILPIKVYDPSSVIKPTIQSSNQVRPDKAFNLTVSEKNGKAMYYTLAVVDEGLLDITQFKTPDPWSYFNRKQSLGVKTWDNYAYIHHSEIGWLDNQFRMGGDAEEIAKVGDTKANRFKPVVKFMGPFYLAPGQIRKHTSKIENYVGSVKVMVVAKKNAAYGKISSTIKVKQPLMIQPNAPRQLTPGDRLKLPVTVFIEDVKYLPATVTIKSSPLITVRGNKEITISKLNKGEATVYFDAEVNKVVGSDRLSFSIRSKNESHRNYIDIESRLPSNPIYKSQQKNIAAGEKITMTLSPVGLKGTNSAEVVLSSIPPISLEKRLKYLIRYPHGCIEQTTSGAFPQLYLSSFIELPSSRKQQIDKNVMHAIRRINQFSTIEGGFSYWPGGNYVSEWGTNYAGHFLIEAKKSGYQVPLSMMNDWKQYQITKANDFQVDNKHNYRQLTQSYRLYILALSGSPQIGAMNRLRLAPKLSNTCKWQLAMAYALAGQKSVAQSLVKDAQITVNNYKDMRYTYGSSFRDKCIILQALIQLKNENEAFQLANKLSKVMNSRDWLSTQETAYGLMALSQAYISNTKGFSVTYSINNGSRISKSTKESMYPITINSSDQTSTVVVQNTGDKPIYVTAITEGVPLNPPKTSPSDQLKMDVTYYDNSGKKIVPDDLEFGKEYRAQIKVINSSNIGRLDQMALTFTIPGGWELKKDENKRNLNVDFEDFRDDKVLAYFYLSDKGSKTFNYYFTASFPGSFVYPGISCEAMYDHSIFTAISGGNVTVSNK